eukprot:5281044-Prymnesium_polylepis.1
MQGGIIYSLCEELDSCITGGGTFGRTCACVPGGKADLLPQSTSCATPMSHVARRWMIGTTRECERRGANGRVGARAPGTTIPPGHAGELVARLCVLYS